MKRQLFCGNAVCYESKFATPINSKRPLVPRKIFAVALAGEYFKAVEQQRQRDKPVITQMVSIMRMGFLSQNIIFSQKCLCSARLCVRARTCGYVLYASYVPACVCVVCVFVCA